MKRKFLFIASIAVICTTGCTGGGTNSSQVASSVKTNSSVAATSTSSVASATALSLSSQIASSSVTTSSSAPLQSDGQLSEVCVNLVNNSATNWDESSLSSDQEIVKCLYNSLGRPLGYGEKAAGGFDPNGNSHLIVIKKNTGILPEKQLLDAINSANHNWIVFDKNDFQNGSDIAMYRLHCSNAGVLAALNGASEAECLNHRLWCSNRGINDEKTCNHSFFTEHLNDGNLPIRDEMVNSNTTIDGRGSNARILFNGFKVGADASGVSEVAARSVIIAHMLFEGAYHEEDHGLDPDLLRITGESHDIWVHKNTFQFSGDSAFDVKVGAYDVTFSFNKIVDVVRTSLHGSNDSREINQNITTTMHNNLFLTSEKFSDTGAPGDKAADTTGRRTPLIRRGKSHLFNNVFLNYYKEFASVRVGATLYLEDNVFLASDIIRNRKSDTQAAFEEWLTNITKGVLVDGSFASSNGLVSFVNGNCQLDISYQGLIPATLGNAAQDLKENYSSTTKKMISDNQFEAGQDLVNYVLATAGHNGELSYLSPLAKMRAQILAQPTKPCI